MPGPAWPPGPPPPAARADGPAAADPAFASISEREGSGIARQIARATLHRQIKVCYVTHMYDLAYSFHAQQPGAALLLRAGREPDGRRTFRLADGEPLPASYGQTPASRPSAPPGPPATAAG